MNFNILKKQTTKPDTISINQFQLNHTEIEVLLKLISTCMFPVKDIELLYGAIYKLQEQHKILTPEIK